MRIIRLSGLGSLAVIVTALLGGQTLAFGSGMAPGSMAITPRAPGTRAEFVYLKKQNSNSCGLQPATVESYADSMRLQGSCCFSMDWNHYQRQVLGLRAYHDVQQIPRDPYDIPAATAKQLFRYDRSVHLSRRQQVIYNRAMQLTSEKGPCCCTCWRWHAFEGLSRYLISQKHFTSHQVAQVVSLVDGCGA